MFYKIIYIFPYSTQSKQTSYSCVKETSLLVEVDLHMGGFVEQTFQGFSLMAGESSIDDFRSNRRVMVCDDDEDDPSDSISFSEDSSTSIASTSSDFTDDASSSASHPSSLPSSSPPSSPQQTSSEPLYELSELMAHLPIKRGLSRHYDGKSQSFTSLSNVRCIEDLAKKESPYSKKMKSCKSYGGLLDYHKSYSPGACTRTISKKASRGSFSCLLSKKSSSASSRPPIPIQKTL